MQLEAQDKRKLKQYSVLITRGRKEEALKAVAKGDILICSRCVFAKGEEARVACHAEDVAVLSGLCE